MTTLAYILGDDDDVTETLPIIKAYSNVKCKGCGLMRKKFILVFVITALAVALLTQTVVIIISNMSYNNEITNPYNAIIIAKAALLQRYGEAEIEQKGFNALIMSDNPDHWFVFEVVENPKYDFSPHVLVRRSDGKVTLRWEN